MPHAFLLYLSPLRSTSFAVTRRFFPAVYGFCELFLITVPGLLSQYCSAFRIGEIPASTCLLLDTLWFKSCEGAYSAEKYCC